MPNVQKFPGAAGPPSDADDGLADAGPEADLRAALAHSQFRLDWQPVVACSTGNLLGFEALARWDRPDHAPALAAAFVPAMQHLPQFRRFDAWLLHRACAAVAALPGLFVAINLSACGIRGPGLVATIAAALERTGIEPQRLTIEVSEAIIVGAEPALMRDLARLKALGLRLALDDFGTGPATLGSLHETPFDTLKLDHSFVRRLGQCRRTEIIVRALLQMGKALDLTICAEGVERPDQLAILQAYGCDQVQGFLIGHPEQTLPDMLDLYDRLDRTRLFMATAGGQAGAATWM